VSFTGSQPSSPSDISDGPDPILDHQVLNNSDEGTVLNIMNIFIPFVKMQ
jgi:hypothetical protein